MKRVVGLARGLRRRETDAERRLWARLRDRRLLGFKFRRQHPIAGYVADFVCVERSLVVELDGGQHGSVGVAAYDAERTRRLNGLGFRVLRFWDHDVLRATDAVLAAIEAALGPSPRPSPPPGERGTRRGTLLSDDPESSPPPPRHAPS